MALRALVANGEFDVISPDDDQDNPTVFRCRLLTAAEASRLLSLDAPRFARDGSYKLETYGEAVLYACEKGLIGWRNLVDEEGAQVPFSGTPADLDRLSQETRLFLFSEIKRRCTIEQRDFR